MGGSRPNRFERFTASTALSGSTFCKPPALPEVADLKGAGFSPFFASERLYLAKKSPFARFGPCWYRCTDRDNHNCTTQNNRHAHARLSQPWESPFSYAPLSVFKPVLPRPSTPVNP